MIIILTNIIIIKVLPINREAKPQTAEIMTTNFPKTNTYNMGDEPQTVTTKTKKRIPKDSMDFMDSMDS